MSQKAVRIISAVIAGAIVFSLAFAFIAEIVSVNSADAAESVSSLNSKLSSLEKQKSKIRKELKAIESKKQSTMTKKAALDQQIDVTEKEVDTINDLISALDTKIAAAQEELSAAQAEEQKQTDDFLKRVRIMEEEGSASMLGIILEADSFSEESLDIICPTMRKKGCKVIFSYNPQLPTTPIEKLQRDKADRCVTVFINYLEVLRYLPPDVIAEAEECREKEPDEGRGLMPFSGAGGGRRGRCSGDAVRARHAGTEGLRLFLL